MKNDNIFLKNGMELNYPDDPEAGSMSGHENIRRRKFLKRSGGATASVILAGAANMVSRANAEEDEGSSYEIFAEFAEDPV